MDNFWILLTPENYQTTTSVTLSLEKFAGLAIESIHGFISTNDPERVYGYGHSIFYEINPLSETIVKETEMAIGYATSGISMVHSPEDGKFYYWKTFYNQIGVFNLVTGTIEDFPQDIVTGGIRDIKINPATRKMYVLTEESLYILDMDTAEQIAYYPGVGGY
ncbi:MAG: hypothetical protein KAX49_13220 [Halanaerobiales bacterium]|nr:hypothetical protein [Halanaerobiales bacterium]